MQSVLLSDNTGLDALWEAELIGQYEIETQLIDINNQFLYNEKEIEQ